MVGFWLYIGWIWVMASEIMSESNQQERIRQAVLRRGGTVTVGDVMSETGLGMEEAKSGLRTLMYTHEGIMRVSARGEIEYAFAPGCILRDERSWWERNRKQVIKIIKTIFKVIIMLVLIIYFIIYLLLLLALISSNRNGRSNINIGGVFYWFWGWGDSGTYGTRKTPLYTRVYNFVFGPEEEEIDPLAAKTKCAQLIRAKKGVITVEDWIMVSGQSREKCESDLARFTAEFEGNAEISDNGTLLYVFEEMMTSSRDKSKPELPECAWTDLEFPRSLSGNIGGGDGAVIGLNAFNLIMSFVCMYALSDMLASQGDVPMSPADVAQLESLSFGLGIFPFIFSSLIFLVPLFRLPGNIKENRARRKRTVRKAVLQSVFARGQKGNTAVSTIDACNAASRMISRAATAACVSADEPSLDEVNEALNELSDELGGVLEQGPNGAVYKFPNMDSRLVEASNERLNRRLDEQKFGEAVYSSSNEEQDKIDDRQNQQDLDEFDRLLNGGQSAAPRKDSISANGVMSSMDGFSQADYDAAYSPAKPVESSWKGKRTYHD